MNREKIIAGLILLLCLLAVVAGVVLVIRPGGGKDVLGSVTGKKALSSEPGIAIVYIYGSLFVPEQSGPWGRFLSGTDRIVEQLKKIERLEQVKAVVLRINSPGGTVGSVQEIYNQVGKLKEKGKKIIACTGDVCASGGYYIACASDKIVANPGAITGSVGVIMTAGNAQELFRKIGVKIEVIKSGKYKDMGSPAREMTSEEKTLIQGVIDDAYAQFLDVVVKGRGLDLNRAKDLCQGQIYTGRQAKDAGLVDETGDLRDAIRIAGELSGLGPEPKIIEMEKSLYKLIDFLNEAIPAESVRNLFRARNGMSLEYMME